MFKRRSPDTEEIEPKVESTWMEAPRWKAGFVPFGDRLDFLSVEKQHLATGKLRILPPRGVKERDRNG